MLGSPYGHLYDNIIHGYIDRLLFIDYNKLCYDPDKQMRRIYNFLELPYFKHDFKNVPQSDIVFHSSHLGGHFNKQHDVRPAVEPNNYTHEDYIGKYYAERQKQAFPIFWEEYT